MLDLSNQRFGKLLALKPTEKRRNHFVVWLCRCDCGKQHEVTSNALRAGRIRSCGCERLMKSSYNLEIGRKNLIKNELKDRTLLCGLTRKTPKTNSSGRKGVYYEKREGKWRAHIEFQGKRKYLGYYAKFEDAVKARERAEEELFEPILNAHGRSLYEKKV